MKLYCLLEGARVKQGSRVKCLGEAGTGEGIPQGNVCPLGGGGVLSRHEQCREALVLGANDLLVCGHHLAIVHVHDFGANLATGGY